jgi:hypothetical protein
MSERWKQAGLILLSTIAVWGALIGGFVLLRRYPTVLMPHPGKIGEYIELAILCVAAYVAAVRWIERRAPTELSLRPAPRELVGGLLAGMALVSVTIATLWAAGVFRPQGWRAVAVGPGFVFVLAAAVTEEILDRGLVFRLCSRILGTWGALLVSSAWFAVSHAANSGANIAALLNVALAGVLLGGAYVVTGRLWLPIGLHLGWNFAEGSVFGTAVSGHDVGPSLIRGTLNGPAILTGGAFGPEASIAGLLVVFAATAYLLWQLIARRCAEPAIWRKPRAAG